MTGHLTLTRLLQRSGSSIATGFRRRKRVDADPAATGSVTGLRDDEVLTLAGGQIDRARGPKTQPGGPDPTRARSLEHLDPLESDGQVENRERRCGRGDGQVVVVRDAFEQDLRLPGRLERRP